MKHNYQKLKDLISKANTIAIFGHQSIDGDCIGSMLSFGNICEQLGKKVFYYTPDLPDKNFGFLADIQKITTNFIYQDYDLFVFVDFSPFDRIGDFTKDYLEYFQKQNLLIIDHHIEDNPYATFTIKEKEASSNCELLLKVYENIRPEKINKQIATYLYMGLLTDTGNITYENNTEETLENARKLIHYGADKRRITYNLFRKNKIQTMKLLAKTIARLKTVDTLLLYTYYFDQEHKQENLGTNDTDYITYSLQNIDGFTTFALLKVYEKHIKISFRSRKKEESDHQIEINVATIANTFNGGGHKHAAGTAKIPIRGSLEETIQQITKKITKEIQKQITLNPKH